MDGRSLRVCGTTAAAGAGWEAFGLAHWQGLGAIICAPITLQARRASAPRPKTRAGAERAGACIAERSARLRVLAGLVDAVKRTQGAAMAPAGRECGPMLRAGLSSRGPNAAPPPAPSSLTGWASNRHHGERRQGSGACGALGGGCGARQALAAVCITSRCRGAWRRAPGGLQQADMQPQPGGGGLAAARAPGIRAVAPAARAAAAPAPADARWPSPPPPPASTGLHRQR